MTSLTQKVVTWQGGIETLFFTLAPTRSVVCCAATSGHGRNFSATLVGALYAKRMDTRRHMQINNQKLIFRKNNTNAGEKYDRTTNETVHRSRNM